MKRDKKHFFLLFDDICQLFLIFLKFLRCRLILFTTHQVFDIFGLVLELLDSHDISFDFVFNNFNGGVSYLVGDQKLMELSEITVSLKDIQNVQCELYRLFVVVSQSSRNSSEQSFMFKHDFHVFIT